ncbi:MAG: glucokinase, partial [Desulfobulbales bacterium]|nr:glucokinase [Desulfobulbales bacterium]
TELLKTFLNGCPHHVDSACIGVPGPVLDNQSTTTNLPWLISGASLAKELSIGRVRLVNDLEAAAASVPLLKKDDLYELNKGTRRQDANKAVISPGSGLGEAFLTRNEKKTGYIPYPSEGGHCDFAPMSPLEIELLAHLHEKLGHVSYEQVCSGLGIVNIYNFLKESGSEDEPVWLLEMFDREDDPSRVIVNVAMDKERSYPPCRRTMEIFAAILGAEAGNLALKVMAFGGVYIGGGIPPRIIEILDSDKFLKPFLNKGRMSPLLAGIPVYVITNAQAPMLGAAHLAVSS